MDDWEEGIQRRGGSNGGSTGYFRSAGEDDSDIIRHECRVFDGEGNLKEVIPAMTRGEFRKVAAPAGEFSLRERIDYEFELFAKRGH